MSSEPIEPPRSPHRRRAGLAFSLRLSCYYALFFAAAVTGLFLVAYILIANSQEEAEMQRVAERVAEYQAWFREAVVSLEALENRFEEQSLSSPDVMFVRVVSAKDQFVFFSNPRGQSMLQAEDLKDFDPHASGARLALTEDSEDIENRWTVASAPLTNGLTIQIGKSSRDGELVLARFRRVFIISVAPVILVGLVGGTLVAFRAMLPVRRLNSTISGILRTGDWRRRVTTDDEGARDLSDLSEQFNRLLDKNEQVIDAMHLSLDSVAHDLRTPMTRLRSTAERALEKADPATTDSGVYDALADCLEESSDVLSILETLMELGEAEAGAMRLNVERVALKDIAAHAVELYEFVAEEQKVEIENTVPGDIFLECDRVRMQRLVANLVDNAIKYSPEESTVIIDAVAADRHVEIIVADEGRGIAPSEQARIWDRLYRGDRSRSERGLGLGLSLVRAIAVAHGGTVSVRSYPGKGSTFSVRLPLQPGVSTTAAGTSTLALSSDGLPEQENADFPDSPTPDAPEAEAGRNNEPDGAEKNLPRAAPPPTAVSTGKAPAEEDPPPTDGDLKAAPSGGG